MFSNEGKKRIEWPFLNQRSNVWGVDNYIYDKATKDDTLFNMILISYFDPVQKIFHIGIVEIEHNYKIGEKNKFIYNRLNIFPGGRFEKENQFKAEKLTELD